MNIKSGLKTAFKYFAGATAIVAVAGGLSVVNAEIVKNYDSVLSKKELTIR